MGRNPAVGKSTIGTTQNGRRMYHPTQPSSDKRSKRRRPCGGTVLTAPSGLSRSVPVVPNTRPVTASKRQDAYKEIIEAEPEDSASICCCEDMGGASKSAKALPDRVSADSSQQMSRSRDEESTGSSCEPHVYVLRDGTFVRQKTGDPEPRQARCDFGANSREIRPPQMPRMGGGRPKKKVPFK